MLQMESTFYLIVCPLGCFSLSVFIKLLLTRGSAAQETSQKVSSLQLTKNEFSLF